MGIKRAIYPGSFDPLTFGHLDIIKRAALLFDHLTIAIAVNPAKSPLFTALERMQLIQEVLPQVFALENQNITVCIFEDLLVHLADRLQAPVVIRGLRAVSDFEFEFQMALMNRRLNPALETVFLTPQEDYTFISSRMIKEVARLGGEVSAFVPEAVVQALKERFSLS